MDPGFWLNLDPDPGADPDPKHCFQLNSLKEKIYYFPKVLRNSLDSDSGVFWIRILVQ